MKIVAAETRVERMPLVRPYTIAFRTIAEVQNVIVVLRDQAGNVGLGAASPEPHVTGETPERCRAALAPGSLDFLIGADVRALPALIVELERRLPDAPAARAAIDIALHDLLARGLGASLADLFGRFHDGLPTSITIGIKPTAEALIEADEYLGRGFRVLKVKTGKSLDEDLERLARLREHVGKDVVIRADANQGYTLDETRRFFAESAALEIEFMEQPVKAAAIDGLRALPEAQRRRVAADESLLAPADALRLATPPQPAGIFNIKLMKCGGLRPARAIAAIAEAGGIHLMWGCMDESCISIAAALHAALASPATRYLDLDGSFDLARDVAEGGFTVEAGVMRPTAGPGLGVRLRD
jgi:L-alanine-DL-glutamate epimerase-like enolase superfamily enzyme